jgi:deazaflavin-dependent oxidoreductase (nitroreductase family)
VKGSGVSRNDLIIEEFRANAGKVGGHFEGWSLLLLHTTGARSGKERVIPLVYVMDGDRYLVAASKGGADSHPDWFYNLHAAPDVTLEVGGETIEARAVFPTDAERDELYAMLAARYSFFAGYQEGTDRVIPVVALEPVG